MYVPASVHILRETNSRPITSEIRIYTSIVFRYVVYLFPRGSVEEAKRKNPEVMVEERKYTV